MFFRSPTFHNCTITFFQSPLFVFHADLWTLCMRGTQTPFAPISFAAEFTISTLAPRFSQKSKISLLLVKLSPAQSRNVARSVSSASEAFVVDAFCRQVFKWSLSSSMETGMLSSANNNTPSSSGTEVLPSGLSLSKTVSTRCKSSLVVLVSSMATPPSEFQCTAYCTNSDKVTWLRSSAEPQSEAMRLATQGGRPRARHPTRSET
mmetsp:Transcript_28032/g.80450  ORF Transcript_28032/g.80450 Transcript_28032/m.80450 type:complete len:206 (+) Transcript_28032:248-865(+)